MRRSSRILVEKLRKLERETRQEGAWQGFPVLIEAFVSNGDGEARSCTPSEQDLEVLEEIFPNRRFVIVGGGEPDAEWLASLPEDLRKQYKAEGERMRTKTEAHRLHLVEQAEAKDPRVAAFNGGYLFAMYGPGPGPIEEKEKENNE